MDGGYLEAEMMAKAGATHVVVMARAHAETIKCVVQAGRDFGAKVMGDNMVCDDKAAASRWMEDLGVDYIVHHTGFDERNGIMATTGQRLSPLDDLKAVVEAVRIPVQAVGGLSIEEAISMPKHGAPLVVIGAEVGGDCNGVERAAHALDDAIRHPVVGRPAARHAHEPRRLTGKHATPDVEIALRLPAGNLPVVEAGIFGQGQLPGHPL